MERADALYGVTMQPSGASRAVSQRLRTRPVQVAMTSAEGASVLAPSGFSDGHGELPPPVADVG